VALTPAQKKWAIGSGIGAFVLAVGYGLFSRPALAAPPSRSFQVQPPRQHKRKKHPHTRHDHDKNERGEYGRRKKRHRRHGHD
jgi:hypothetical protein